MGVWSAVGRGFSQILARGGAVFGPPRGGEGNNLTLNLSEGERGGGIKDKFGKKIRVSSKMAKILLFCIIY